MNAILFPGQGSQVVGMGLEFYNNFEIVKNIFKEADEKLSFKLSKMILEGPEDELKLTQNTQPAILTVSYAIFSVLKKEFNFDFKNSKFFAGHSLGEYSALVCSESLSFNDALFLLFERGKSMQEAVPVGKGSMIAVLGSKLDEVKIFLDKIKQKGVCEIANDNADGQIIISGDTESIRLIQNILKDNKKKFIPLNVSAPFHCSMMKPAADKMKDKINSINFQKPIFDIVCNVTSQPENNPENIKKLLVDQIFSTVRWRESIINMYNQKVNNFIEIGPGKVLSGMVKRTVKNINSFSINSINDMKKTVNESKK
ncbi:MAG: [acyl-carrier-protein] S-malonyltransferase [Candidatus Pelagibacter sp. TMED128]|nr:MAG: [acyl-carrier-protein] S-malonyltransferase [Candidatus Pelagibacter sp. TMED128]|tara:strand:+ start:7975 stop:8913 length:939 start_codon:yes stop_codon:yes gene_type:complete